MQCAGQKLSDVAMRRTKKAFACHRAPAEGGRNLASVLLRLSWEIRKCTSPGRDGANVDCNDSHATPYRVIATPEIIKNAGPIRECGG